MPHNSKKDLQSLLDENEHHQLPLLSRMIVSLRRRILVGLVTIIPIVCVIFVVVFSVNKIYELFESTLRVKQYVFTAKQLEEEGVTVEEMGVTEEIKSKFMYYKKDGKYQHISKLNYVVGGRIIAILFFVVILYIFGLLSGTFIVRRTIHLGERIVDRIPFVKTIYKGSKQLVETVSMQQHNSLREVILVEYPRKDAWVVGYVTGHTNIANTGEHFLNLFVPTTPNPTSGFMLLAREDEVLATNLTIEEAVKYVVSAGIVVPENMQTLPYPEGHKIFPHLQNGNQRKSNGKEEGAQA